VEEDAERKRKIKGKGKEKVVDVEEDAERKRKFKVKGKEKLVDSEEGSGKNKRINKQKNNSVLKGRATVRQLFEAMRGLSPERKKVIREMGFRDLIKFPIFEIPTKLAFYVVDILNTTNMTLECPMGDIVITPKTVKIGSWTANGEKETRKRRPERVQRSILATVERPVQKCQQAHNKSVIRLLKNVFEGDDVSGIDWCSYIIECASVSKLDWAKKLEKKRCVLWASDVLDVKRRLPAFKSWNTSLLKKIAELQNDYMGIEEIQDDVGEGEEPNQKEQRMKDIFKEPDMPEYLSSSSSESDDDNDDGSQLADENEESYRKETHSNDEDNVEIVAEIQKDE
ncbi:hypothetical protein Tco_1199218, partial [Tanacetum coccineum]